MRFFLLPAILVLASCRPEWRPPEHVTLPEIHLPEAVRRLPPADAAAIIESGGEWHILDLRTEEELAREGRLPRAAHVDFFHHEALARHLEGLEKDRPCLLCCALGGRAERAALRMHEGGFTRLHVLEGGVHEWIKSGRPMLK